MGYIYDRWNQLVCDGCGTSGGVRRRRCPFGYCPAPALCDGCHKREKWGYKATHRARGCEVAHERFVAERKREADLFAAGFPVRCSALNASTLEDLDRVHVLFRVRDGDDERTIGRYMPKSVYRAHPIGAPVALSDYEATHGSLLPEAPPTYEYGGTSKQSIK